MINVHQTGCQKPPASSLLGLLLVVNIWSIWSESCLVELQHDTQASKTEVSVLQNPITKVPVFPTFPLHRHVIGLERNQKSSNLWTLWPGAGCYEWFDLGKDHRSVHPRLTAFADASLRASAPSTVLMMMNHKLFSGRENERRQILHRFVKTDLWTFRKTLRWKK